jgi:hypothetical protein
MLDYLLFVFFVEKRKETNKEKNTSCEPRPQVPHPSPTSLLPPCSDRYSAAGTCKYIIYLVPQGELYSLLERYYEESRSVCVNDAHDYLPHCTLTSFFTLPKEEDFCAVFHRRLTSALERVVATVALDAHHDQGKRPEPLAWVESLYDKDGAIGLAVRAPKIISAIQRLADEMDGSAAKEGGAGVGEVVISPKTRLHISMAYGGGVTRAGTPQLYTLARELNTRRQNLSEPIQWRVELLRQEAHHAGQPKLWMLDALWSSLLPTP